MCNREVTIHRKWRHLVHKTHDEDIQQNKKQKKHNKENNISWAIFSTSVSKY
jgi:hypothetical protein